MVNQTFCLLNSTSVQSVKCRVQRGGKSSPRSKVQCPKERQGEGRLELIENYELSIEDFKKDLILNPQSVIRNFLLSIPTQSTQRPELPPGFRLCAAKAVVDTGVTFQVLHKNQFLEPVEGPFISDVQTLAKISIRIKVIGLSLLLNRDDLALDLGPDPLHLLGSVSGVPHESRLLEQPLDVPAI